MSAWRLRWVNNDDFQHLWEILYLTVHHSTLHILHSRAVRSGSRGVARAFASNGKRAVVGHVCGRETTMMTGKGIEDQRKMEGCSNK
jgi:hypothetical protein